MSDETIGDLGQGAATPAEPASASARGIPARIDLRVLIGGRCSRHDELIHVSLSGRAAYCEAKENRCTGSTSPYALRNDAAAAARAAELDAERNERDRRLGRGYDYAITPVPSPAPDRAAIDREVIDEIDRVASAALRSGWRLRRLVGEQFWPVEKRGLAAVMGAGDRVVEVTAGHLSIRKNDGRATLLRFSKPREGGAQ